MTYRSQIIARDRAMRLARRASSSHRSFYVAAARGANRNALAIRLAKGHRS